MSSYTKLSISLPVDLVIKVDLKRSGTYQSRSGWVKEAIEEKLQKLADTDKNETSQPTLFNKE